MVYLVRDLQTDEQKALKISPDMLALVREFTILDKLKNIAVSSKLIPQVELVDDGVINGLIFGFIIMEYIEGSNLRSFMQHRKLSLKEICTLAKLLGMLLMLLHDCGYAYCDLKPENILFDTRRAIFRLVDFGGVREIGSSVTQFTPAFDRASYSCGTRKADPCFDAFALAALMVALATGKDPHPGRPESSDTPAIIASVWKKARQNKLKDVAELLRECDGYTHPSLLPSRKIKVAIYGVGFFSLILFSITLTYLLH